MPLGWHISVYRQLEQRTRPADFDSEMGERLCVWQAGLDGVDWLEKLVAEGEATGTIGNGYPGCFSAPARTLIPVLQGDIPCARSTWSRDPGDLITPGWEGTTATDHEVINSCDPEEWLLIRIWDES